MFKLRMYKSEILEILNSTEKLSDCPKRHVAAVLIATHGRYMRNGTNTRVLPHKKESCTNCVTGVNVEQCPAIHAEASCIINSSFYDTNKATLAISYSPCPECCKLIMAAKISRVLIKEPRLKTPPVVDCVNYKVSTYDGLAEKLLSNVEYVRLWEMPEDWQV